MQYGIGVPHIISDASTGKESEKRVMDGIIHSAMLTSTQRQDIDGLIQSAIPHGKEKESSKKHKGGNKPAVTSTKGSKTPQDFGARHYPGSKYA